MKNLADIIESIPESAGGAAEIDLSEQLGEKPGTTIFTFKEPTAAQLFQAGEDGKKLSVRYPEMTEAMGSMVATIALAHVLPAATAPALLYAKLATKNGKLFMWLLERFLEAYPHLKNLEAQTQAAKKPSSLE